jgi:hypothetical protein
MWSKILSKPLEGAQILLEYYHVTLFPSKAYWQWSRRLPTNQEIAGYFCWFFGLNIGSAEITIIELS